jgi:hypothetical protein
VYGENSSGNGYGLAGRASGKGNAVFGDNTNTAGYAGNFRGNIAVSGTASKPGGGPWSGFSDVRLKKEVRPFKAGLAELDGVNPVVFQYNGLGDTVEDGRDYVGVIAQELKRSMPMMVTARKGKLHRGDAKDADLEQVDPNAFTYMLINAVKEQQIRIKQLESRVKTVEAGRRPMLSSLGGIEAGWTLGLLPLGAVFGMRLRKKTRA